MKRIIAVLLVLMMALSVFSACDTVKDGEGDNENVNSIPADDAVMIKIDDYEITFGDLNDVYNYYYDMYVSYGMLDPANKEELEEFKNMLIDYQLENIVPAFAAEKLGIELDEEEQKELDTLYENQLMSLLSQYDDKIDATMTDEAMIYDAKVALFKDDLKTQGVDYDEYMARQKQDMYLSVLSNKMIESKVGGITVDEETVKAEYDARIAALQEEYSEDVLAYYEDYQEVVAGTAAHPNITPEGYYYVTYIYVADMSEDIRDYDAQAILAEIEGKLEAIKAEKDVDKRIEQFKALVQEYGQDPVLQMAPFSEEGMLIHAEMTDEYYKEFLDAAFALENKGDISESFRTESGTHIMMRLETLEANVVEYEELKDALEEELVNEKQNEAYEAAMAEWKELVKPVVKTEYLKYFGVTQEELDAEATVDPNTGC